MNIGLVFQKGSLYPIFVPHGTDSVDGDSGERGDSARKNRVSNIGRHTKKTMAKKEKSPP